MVGDKLLGAALGKVVFQLVEQSEPSLHVRHFHSAGQGNMPGHALDVLHGKGSVGHPQEARADRVARADADECGKIEFRVPQLHGGHRTDVGMLDAGIDLVAGVQQVSRALVVVLVPGHRPDQGDVIELLRDLGPVLGDPNARQDRVDRLGRAAGLGARFGIPRFELTGASLQEKHDTGHAPLAQLVGLGAESAGPAEGRASRQAGSGSTQERPSARSTVARHLYVEIVRRHVRDLLALRTEFRRVHQDPLKIFEGLAPIADLLDMIQARLKLVRRWRTPQPAKIERAHHRRVFRDILQDRGKERLPRRLNVGLERRIVHQEQGLRDRAFNILSRQRRVEAEGLIEQLFERQVGHERYRRFLGEELVAIDRPQNTGDLRPERIVP